MTYKELDIEVGMPATDNAYSLKIHVSGYEDAEQNKSFELRVIQWQTYCDKLNDDVQHYIFGNWMQANDLLDLIAQVREMVEDLSS